MVCCRRSIRLLIFCYHDMHHNLSYLKPSELRDYIARVDPSRVKFIESENHYRSLFKTSPETFRTFYIHDTSSGKTVDYVASADSDTEQLLAARAIPFRLIYEGRDFEVLGTPGRLLPLLAAFIIGVGGSFPMEDAACEAGNKVTLSTPQPSTFHAVDLHRRHDGWARRMATEGLLAATSSFRFVNFCGNRSY